MTNKPTFTAAELAFLDRMADRMAPHVAAGGDLMSAFASAVAEERALCREMVASQSERSQRARQALASDIYTAARIRGHRADCEARIAAELSAHQLRDAHAA